MQKLSRSNSHEETISTMPAYKTDIAHQAELLGRVPKEQKRTLTAEKEDTSVLAANKAREFLSDLDGWHFTDDHKMITRDFISHDFMAAIDLIDRIALIAQKEMHHPDIHLTQCRNLRIGLTTHDAGGLTHKDFTVAMKIKGLQTGVAPKKENKMTKEGAESEKIVGEAMHKYKVGKLKSGGSGKVVKDRKQAIAIGLSEARKKTVKRSHHKAVNKV